MTEITVRVGSPDDLDEVVKLARMMHEEIGVASLADERMIGDIWAALNLEHGIMGLIGEPGGHVEAGVLLRIGKVFYSIDDVLEEKGLFVHPDYRAAKGARARLLCEFAKSTADTLGLPLAIGVFNDVRTGGKMRLYERQFGPPVGAFFLHMPGAAHSKEAA